MSPPTFNGIELYESPYLPPNTVYAVSPRVWDTLMRPVARSLLERVIMPPTPIIESNIAPHDRGSYELACSLNYVPAGNSPLPVRASMWPDTVDPFKFFLTQICEIKPIIPADHMWFGECFHDHLQAAASPNYEDLPTRMDGRIAEICRSLQAPEAFVNAVTDRLRATARKSYAAVRALSQVPASASGGSIMSYLTQERWRNLMVEDYIVLAVGDGPIMLKPDRVIFDRTSNKIWVMDYKTTTKDPAIRMMTCTYEFQSQLNAWAFGDDLLPSLIRIFDLPAATTFGGFIHVCVQQPTIIQSGIDVRAAQALIADATPVGQTPVSPTPDQITMAYYDRVRHWYLRTGPYEAAQSPERIRISASHWDDAWRRMVRQSIGSKIRRVRDLLALRIRTSQLPIENPWYSTGVGYYGEDDFDAAYGKFYGTPLSMWGTIMAEDHLTITRRSLPIMHRINNPQPDDLRPDVGTTHIKGMTVHGRYLIPG